ncbi:MAG: FMN-dependent NADH-azoreductase [SAR116 cluster bacterium MED-G06]|jgi:FMN-dependent NADH-azoreductase|nr:MAG: FMN-dependent NADH-azoreductase [SAR116 cluster bacterium MED-G06]|tara:strand:- start:4505 stop:5146 length:642 start_codon:yes stop_codon:yes gene_type:complete
MSVNNKTILRIDASMRRQKSVSRMLADEMVAALGARKPGTSIINRDLAAGIGIVNAAWIEAERTSEENRTPDQRALLAQSDALVAELHAADDIVIATPIYNFSVPAALKAWIDLICRDKITFSYENDVPRGLLSNKQATVIITSGGTVSGNEIDYATGYIRHILEFIGVRDVTIIDVTGLSKNRQGVIADARTAINTASAKRLSGQRNLSVAE